MKKKAEKLKEEKKPEPVVKTPGLAALEGALGSSAQELKNIWFDKKHAFATDGHFGIQIPYKSDFSFGVPGEVLIKMLKSGNGAAKLDVDEECLLVVFGRSHAALPVTDLESGKKYWGFPTSPAKAAQALVLTEEILAAFQRIIGIRGDKNTSLLHRGIIAIPDKTGLVLYSTDSKSLGETHVKVPSKDMEPVIFPYEFVEAMVRYCVPDDELYVMDNCLAVYGKDIAVFSAMIDASELPDSLEKTVDSFMADEKGRAPVPEGLESALARAKVLAGKSDPIVQLTTNGKELTIKAKLDFGNLEENLPCKLPVASLKVNADRLAKLIDDVDEISVIKKGVLLFDKDTLFILAAHGGG